MEWLAIALISLLAGTVQGAIGFGYGLTLMAFLALLLPVKETAVISMPSALAINAFLCWRLRSYLHLREHLPVVVAVIVGAPLGVLLLKFGNKQMLSLLLGIILLASGWQTIRRSRGQAAKAWPPTIGGIPCGLLSGALSGAYGTGGPPVVAYVSSQGYERQRYAATVQTLLAIGQLVRMVTAIASGVLTVPLLQRGLLAAVLAVSGAAIGVTVLHRLPEARFRRLLAIALMLLAARYLWLAATG